MSRQPTVIYSAASTQQAYLLKGLLEEEGITAWVINDAIQIAGGDLPLGWAAAPRVVVAQPDAPQARQLAEEFDRQTAHEPTADDFGENVPADWLDWPTCPGCGERRAARCPVCGASGTNFPLADAQDPAAGRVLLLCKECDDHILPEWYRLCPRCGHDYGGGVEVNPPAELMPSLSRSERIVIVILALSGIALAAYFAWLFGWRVGW
jgi:putative signal transducing protein